MNNQQYSLHTTSIETSMPHLLATLSLVRQSPTQMLQLKGLFWLDALSLNLFLVYNTFSLLAMLYCTIKLLKSSQCYLVNIADIFPLTACRYVCWWVYLANSGQTVIIDSCLNDYAVITVLCYVHKEGRSNIIQKISVQVKSIVTLCMYIDSRGTGKKLESFQGFL